MVLDLLKKSSLGFFVLFIVGCTGPQAPTKAQPAWILDPTLKGKYPNAVSSCYINKNNYSTKRVKKLLLMKLKSSHSLQNNTSIETKNTQYNDTYSHESRQSSVKSYTKKSTVLNKYKQNKQFCLHVNFN